MIKINYFNKAVIILISLACFWPCLAQTNQPDLIINEIAWMGTENSANDEWIELKNNTSQTIDLKEWTLKAEDGAPEIHLQGTIAAQGYFLLERTDETTLPEISANQIYSGALNNSGEKLFLFNPENKLIDSINCSEGWTAGDNQTKQTMERTESNWQTSQNPGGTPKTNNSPGIQETDEPETEPQLETSNDQNQSTTTPPIQEPDFTTSAESASLNQPPIAQAGPDITALTNQEIPFDGTKSTDPNKDQLNFFWNFGDGATDTQASTTHAYQHPGEYLAVLEVDDGQSTNSDSIKINIYSDNLIISEFIPNPKGKDSENEWIEIYNKGNQVADLSNWQLDDIAQGSKPFTFSRHTLITPKQFIVFQRTITKLALNNDEDQVRLIYPNGEIASEISYFADKKEGQSVAFDGTNYFWTTIPTPGTTNIISDQTTEKTAANPSNNPKLRPQKSLTPFPAAEINFNQSETLQAQEAKSENNSLKIDPQHKFVISAKENGQAAIVHQTFPANKIPELILILSIIISGSLLIGWWIIIKQRKAA